MPFEPLNKIQEAQERLADLQVRIAADFEWQKRQGASYDYLSTERPVTNDEWKKIKKCPSGRCKNWCIEIFNKFGNEYGDSWYWGCADCHMKIRLRLIDQARQMNQEEAERRQLAAGREAARLWKIRPGGPHDRWLKRQRDFINTPMAPLSPGSSRV